MEMGDLRESCVSAGPTRGGGGFVDLLAATEMAIGGFLDLGGEEESHIMQGVVDDKHLLGRYPPPPPSSLSASQMMLGLPYGRMLSFGGDGGGVVVYERPQMKAVAAPSATRAETTTSSSTTSSSSTNAAGLGKPKKAEEKRSRSSVGGSGGTARATATKTSKKPRKSQQSSTTGGNGSSGGGTKARKPKLGDRIIALQQLVSPFGKSDTASVLHEALGYIRFLHDQVQVLSSPYLQEQLLSSHHQSSLHGSTDLRSRGLCLVPVSCAAHVADSTSGADLWSPASAQQGGRGEAAVAKH